MKAEAMNRRGEAFALVWTTSLVIGLGACASDDPSADKPRTRTERPAHDAGSKQAVEDEPIRGVTQASLAAIWGSGPDDVWAVGGDGVILRFDGTTLTRLESGTTSRLQAVVGTDADDVWIAGDEGVTLHWNGEQLEKVFESENEAVLGIWPNARDDVWFVGIVPAERAALVRRWDGAGFHEQVIHGAASLWEAWASTPEDLWLVGTSPNLQGIAFHGDGHDFAAIDYEGGPIRGVWGSGREDVWLLPYESTPLQHWDGSALSKSDEVPEVGMLGTWGSRPDDVWAVGLSGTILHYDGSHWASVSSPTQELLASVWGSAADDVWIAGGSGTLLRWNGEAWRVFAAGGDTAADADAI